MQLTAVRAKPFIKWAGGKNQLLPEIIARLPANFSTVKRYIEPFVGGGALFFNLAQFRELREIIISDINDELLIVYLVVKNDVESLIKQLSRTRKTFISLDTETQEKFYYEQRELFNETQIEIGFSRFQSSWTKRAAQFIFLNHTCFNGLYRTNSKLKFNVPFGKYRNPGIFDENNLYTASDILQKVEIIQGDFETCEKFVDEQTFVYLDPPYRPISKTSSFSTYYKAEFDDAQQIRLADFYKRLDKNGAKLMLSNSDPKNENPNDDFFDELYQDFKIERVKASRAINSNGAKRGQINELLITNY